LISITGIAELYFDKVNFIHNVMPPAVPVISLLYMYMGAPVVFKEVLVDCQSASLTSSEIQQKVETGEVTQAAPIYTYYIEEFTFESCTFQNCFYSTQG
jgi:hypothetical protein